MRIKIRTISALLIAMLFTTQPVWAAGPPAPSIFGSALALSLLLLQAVLLLVIGIAVAVTSIPVIARIFHDLGILHTRDPKQANDPAFVNGPDARPLPPALRPVPLARAFPVPLSR